MPSSGRTNQHIERLRRAFVERAGTQAVDLDRPHAVVAAILREYEGDTELLLIRRAHHERDPWSGHMALPGGHRDGGDPDVLHTAVRETREEVGLDLVRDAELLGRLSGVRAIARGRVQNLEIVPLVFALHGAADTRPDPREVQEVVWAKLSPLISGAAATTFDYAHDGRLHALPAFDVSGRIVWGLTYRILRDLFALLDP